MEGSENEVSSNSGGKMDQLRSDRKWTNRNSVYSCSQRIYYRWEKKEERQIRKAIEMEKVEDQFTHWRLSGNVSVTSITKRPDALNLWIAVLDLKNEIIWRISFSPVARNNSLVRFSLYEGRKKLFWGRNVSVIYSLTCMSRYILTWLMLSHPDK